jgi:hypothetical protein
MYCPKSHPSFKILYED